MSISRTKMLQVSKCLIGLAVMVLQSCDITDNRRDLLCGNWESVEGKPDVLIYKEGEAYCNLQIFLCLFLEKLNMPQNTPVTKAS